MRWVIGWLACGGAAFFLYLGREPRALIDPQGKMKKVWFSLGLLLVHFLLGPIELGYEMWKRL